jgi:hypothetical protein
VEKGPKLAVKEKIRSIECGGILAKLTQDPDGLIQNLVPSFVISFVSFPKTNSIFWVLFDRTF